MITLKILQAQRYVALLLVLMLGMLTAFPALSLDRLELRAFVEQQYRDFLGREGEAEGVDYWTRELERGRVTHAEIADLFFSSREFQDNIAPVARLYFAYFGRIPDYPGLMYWVEARLSGGDLEQMSQAFADSSEFVATYGALGNAAFVDRVYTNVLGRLPDSAGRTHWVNALRNGMSRGAMMVAFSESEEYWNRSYHQVQVTMMYVSMLRRSPEQSGFQYWVSVKAAGGSILDLIDGFLRSGEYLQRLSLDSSSSFAVTATAGSGGRISPGTQRVSEGDRATFTLAPDTGYAIDAVSGCGGSLSGTTYTTGAITGACTVEASFAQLSYTVTAEAGSGGSIDPASQEVTHGETASFEVTPDAGFLIEAVNGCGGSLSGTTYTTDVITGACIIEANFNAFSHEISFVTFGGSALESLINPYNSTVTLPLERPIRADSVFIEWNTHTDGSGTSYRPGDVLGPTTEDIVLYAQWGSLSAPEDLRGRAWGEGNITLTWSPVSGSTEYWVYISPSANIQPDEPASYQRRVRVSNQGYHTFFAAELEMGMRYHFVVTTVYVTDQSLPSAEVSLIPSRTPMLHLNDTGIDWCADNHSNHLDCPVEGFPLQDGDVGRDALARSGQLLKQGSGFAGFDFIKLDANGAPLVIQDRSWRDDGEEADGTRWSCVRDNHTGLIWEVKLNNVGHLQYAGHTYTWYSPDQDIQGGNPGTLDGGLCAESACDTYSYTQAVNLQTLCGADDWRVPSTHELRSIVYRGRTNPTIDELFFPNTSSALFWSSISVAERTQEAWGIRFDNADEHWRSKDSPSRVRLVREP